MVEITLGGTLDVIERHMVTARGNDRWARVQGALVADYQGHGHRVLAYYVDNTDEHLAQESLAKIALASLPSSSATPTPSWSKKQ